tara:strand:- start:213 stop:860 length:648 start_codon:yes stop_codon:yes gene_type:complete
MKIPKSMTWKYVQFFYLLNYKKLVQNYINNGDKVLEVGSGLGFLKKLILQKGGFYSGFEPRLDAYEAATNLYGKDHFYNSQLTENINNSIFDKIIAITVIDEIADKKKFINDVKSYSNKNTKIIFIVRNLNFPFRKGSKVWSSYTNLPTEDLGYSEWVNFFKSEGLDIISIEKTHRPLITSFTVNGIKNILIRFLDIFLPKKKNHMLCFILKLSD